MTQNVTDAQPLKLQYDAVRNTLDAIQAVCTDFHYRAGEDLVYWLRRRLTSAEVERVELQAAYATQARLMAIFQRIYALVGPEDIKLPDGRVMRFNDPDAAATLHALSEAIRSIPEVIATEDVRVGTDDAETWKLRAIEAEAQLKQFKSLVRAPSMLGAVVRPTAGEDAC